MKAGKMRLLAAVLVIALLAVSWYTMIDNAAKEEAKYNAYLQAARDKRAKDLVEDAQDYYLATLQLRDTIELRLEIADFYLEKMDANSYIKYCEQVIEDYPYEPSIYERLCNYYKDRENYHSCYSIINVAAKRGIKSNVLNAVSTELAYKYQLRNLGIKDVNGFSEGFCAVYRHDGKWGYINNVGATVIPFNYVKARPVGTGLAGVWSEDGTFMLVNAENRPKSKDSHKRTIEDCTMLSEGLIALLYDGKYHYCDWELEEKFGAYDFAGVFSDGVAAVANGGQWRIIDTAGSVVSKQVFEDIKTDELGVAFRNGRGFAKINGQYIMIDTKGNRIGKESWEDVDVFKSAQPAAVKKGGKWGYVDTSGAVVGKYQFTNAKSFMNNMAAVEIDSAWGYIGTDFAVKIQPDFENAMYFASEGYAFVYKENKWRLLRIYRLT